MRLRIRDLVRASPRCRYMRRIVERDWRDNRDEKVRGLKAAAPRLTLVSRFTPHVSRFLFSILLGIALRMHRRRRMTFPPKTTPLARKSDGAVMGRKEEPMTRKRHMEEQIIAVLKDAQAGVSVQDLCRKHGISDATF